MTNTVASTNRIATVPAARSRTAVAPSSDDQSGLWATAQRTDWMSGSTAQSLVLREPGITGATSAPWAGGLLALGARLARQARLPSDRRLVVALALPTRDLAAVLIATGWVLARPVEASLSPAESLATLEPGVPVRMLVGTKLMTDRYWGTRTVRGSTQVHVGPSFWQLDKVKHLAAAPEVDDQQFGRHQLPNPHSLPALAGREASWWAEQVSSPREVALVGARSIIDAECQFMIGYGGRDAELDRVDDLLRPFSDHRSACGSLIVPASSVDVRGVPSTARLVVADGNSAVGRLADMAAESVVAVLDRSIADEFAADSVLRLRSMGTPMPLESLGWAPPAGVEALAFEVWR